MLRQSLKGIGVDPAALLEQAGIEPTRRAEEIEVEGFVRLANALGQLRKSSSPPLKPAPEK